jgi:hypothetical protein
MYKIIKDNELNTYSDHVAFITAVADGDYREALNPSVATGIVLNGTVYALVGNEDQYPGKEAVAFEVMDGGEVSYNLGISQEGTDEMTVDHEFRLVQLELLMEE